MSNGHYGSIDIGDTEHSYQRINSSSSNSPQSTPGGSTKKRESAKSSTTRALFLTGGCVLLIFFLYYTLPRKIQLPSNSTDNEVNPILDAEITTEKWFHHQLVDHFHNNNDGGAASSSNSSSTNATEGSDWSHRYFERKRFFGGPGHPILFVMGGEGPMHSLLYPFVHNHLAREFKAYVLQAEHRFYGRSQPAGNNKTNANLIQLLSPEQALADYLRLLRHIQTNELGCSLDRSSDAYCPVITIGASYPGFLSAMMRFLHPDVIDIGYASSAPLPLYAQKVHPNAYYNKITAIAERSSAGCPQAVKSTIHEMVDTLQSVPFMSVAEKMNVCVDTIPEYMNTNEIFISAITFIIGFKYADFSMGNYPPTADTAMARACRVFQNNDMDLYETMNAFFDIVLEDDGDEISDCFDVRTQIPKGPNATVLASDWSGAGDGNTGWMWDFQTGKDLIVRAGFSNESMFYPREWTLDWLTQHTQSRFGINPEPYRLVHKWGFDDLVGRGASRILFTNGLNDGWEVASITKSLSDSLIAMNFPNGAHHSEISHEEPGEHDTDDIKEGHRLIPQILRQWLNDIQNENKAVDTTP